MNEHIRPNMKGMIYMLFNFLFEITVVRTQFKVFK